MESDLGAKYDSEAEIAAGLRNGDKAAFRALYGAYVGYLTGVCSRYVSDPDDVKDVLHDCFLKVFASASKFEYRGMGSLKAWITRIVVNESLKFLRANYRYELVALSDDTEIIEADEPPEINAMSMETLHRIICELPPGYRMVFNLYVFEEKSHKEIAEILHIKESSSASQFHRAKAMLAAKIKEYQSNCLES